MVRCSWGDRPPSGGFVIYGTRKLRTIVYVDGYNLYYGLLRRSPYKWLDLVSLFQDHVLNNSANVVEVRYYTAPVLGKLCDDPSSPLRQRTYLQALRKHSGDRLVIIEGKMVTSEPFLRLVDPIPEAPHLTHVRVFTLTEKKTDVNLAADLITGAFTGAYDQAVVCSNDMDLEGAFSAVKKHLPMLKIGLVAPIPKDDHRHISNTLKQHADWVKILSPVHLAAAQLPNKIPHTSIRKPDAWNLETKS